MKLKAWIVVLIGFSAGVALALQQNKVAPNVTFIMDDLQIGMATAGWLMSIFSVMGMVMALPSAFLLNKLGTKTSGLIALGSAIVGTLIGIYTDSIAMLLISRVIEGFGVGLISVVGPALIYMWFPVLRRGFPMGIWGAWQMVAQAVVFFISGYITLNYGWKGVWWFCLIVCVIVAILYAWKVTNPPDENNYADIESANISYKAGFSSISTWFMTVGFLVFNLCAFAFATWIAPYWSETFGWDIDKANKWVSNLYIVEIFTVILVGWILDRVGKRRKMVGMFSFAFYGILIYLAFTMKNEAFIVPMVLAYALFEGAVPAVFWTLCPQTVKDPALAGVALGIFCVGANMGMMAGPPLMGALVENYGWQTGGMVIASLSLVAMALLALAKVYYPEE